MLIFGLIIYEMFCGALLVFCVVHAAMCHGAHNLFVYLVNLILILLEAILNEWKANIRIEQRVKI